MSIRAMGSRGGEAASGDRHYAGPAKNATRNLSRHGAGARSETSPVPFPKQLAMLHHPAPGARRRHQHQAVGVEAHAAQLIGSDATGVGGGVDAGHQRGAVERVGAAIGAVFALRLVVGQDRPGVAQHGHHAPVGREHHDAHRVGAVGRMHRLARVVARPRHDQTPCAHDVVHALSPAPRMPREAIGGIARESTRVASNATAHRPATAHRLLRPLPRLRGRDREEEATSTAQAAPPPLPPPRAGEGARDLCALRLDSVHVAPAFRRLDSARRASNEQRGRETRMGARQFGARVKRLEDPALLTGRGRFVDDVKLPGTLEACFVRSPYAHARIRSIDVAPALALPGVHAVLTADDLPGPMARDPIPMILPVLGIAAFRTQLCLARDEVSYAGQTIALVVADSRYVAEDAAALVVVDYEVLPAISDCRDALKPGAAPAHADLASNLAASIPMSYGDVDTAFAGATHVFEEEFWVHRGGGMSLETRAVLANYEPAGDLLTVWSSTQTPHLGRRALADLLARNLETIRVIAPDVGGGFGPKAPFYAEEAVIPAAALRLGRPVKWIEDRREHFMCATQERDQYWKVALALDAQGKILGFRGTMLHDTGAFVPWGIIMPYIAAVTVPGPYAVPAYRLDMTVVLTNKVATTPVRGAGRPQAVFVMERLMDRAARELNLDRAELRRR